MGEGLNCQEESGRHGPASNVTLKSLLPHESWYPNPSADCWIHGSYQNFIAKPLFKLFQIDHNCPQLIKLGAPGISLNERLNGSDIKIGRQDVALLKRLEHLLFYASISSFVPPQPCDSGKNTPLIRSPNVWMAAMTPGVSVLPVRTLKYRVSPRLPHPLAPLLQPLSVAGRTETARFTREHKKPVFPTGVYYALVIIERMQRETDRTAGIMIPIRWHL